MNLPFLWIIAVYFKVVPFEIYAENPLQDFRLLKSALYWFLYTCICDVCNKALRISLSLNAQLHRHRCMLSPAYELMHYDTHNPHFYWMSFKDVVHVFFKTVVLNITLTSQSAVNLLVTNRWKNLFHVCFEKSAALCLVPSIGPMPKREVMG